MRLCSKNKYDSLIDAKLMALRLQSANPKDLVPRFCDICKAWHLWEARENNDTE